MSPPPQWCVKPDKTTHQSRKPQAKPRIACGLCDLNDHRINQCRELKPLANSLHIISPLPQKILSNQENITRTYCRIFSHFHHTFKCTHLPKLRAARAALSQPPTKNGGKSQPTTQKWKQNTIYSTTDPFQASTSGTSSSVESHNYLLCHCFYTMHHLHWS